MITTVTAVIGNRCACSQVALFGPVATHHHPCVHPETTAPSPKHAYRSRLCLEHGLRSHVGDGPIQISRHPGRGASFSGQTKIPNLGFKAMWVNGARHEQDIASRKVLQYAACLRRRGGWGLGYEGGAWGFRVPVRQATLLIGFELDAAVAERNLATCMITLQ